MTNTDIPRASAEVSQEEKAVGESMDQTNRLFTSIDRISATIAALRDTGLTEQQAQYVQALEDEHRDLREAMQANESISDINQTSQTNDSQPVKQENNTIAGTRVLLVEDDLIIRTVAINILKRNGVEVTIAENGKIATELTTHNKYDIILMDMQMPVMDGFQASHIIRHEQKNTVQIIGITANLIQSTDKYYEAGMNDVISKPYNQEKLVNIINKWHNKQVINAIDAVNNTITANHSLFSIKKLQEIGDASFVDRMLRLFVDQVSSSVPALRKAYDEKDFATVRYIIHRMRPSVLNMGIDTLQTEIIEIEELAKSNESSSELNDMISRLETVMAQVTTGINKLLAN